MSSNPLFEPFAFKSLKLKNRIVMAPLTRSFCPDGYPTDDVTAYYRRRAEADVGLIISEGVGVDRPASLSDPNTPRFHGERELAGWQRIIDEVHAGGGVQVGCRGPTTAPRADSRPARPSAKR